jgi:hypothetical protein
MNPFQLRVLPGDAPHRFGLLSRSAPLLLLALACAPGARPDQAALDASPAAERLAPTGGYKGKFNNADQSHADFCVRLRSPEVALRYADGSPSGFALTEDILVPQRGNGVSCPERGMARLDARELVTAASGEKMLFHRGGWGFAGNDPGSAVHYGHVLLSDIDSIGYKYERSDPAERRRGAPSGHWVNAATEPWVGEGQKRGNGTACSELESEPHTVSVRSIPGDMRYLNTAQTTTISYAIYGDPSEDLGPPADRARGIKYTMMTWSWINVRGGGVARALVEDGDDFFRCTDVPPIRLASVADAETKAVTGWVEAVYGAVRTGDGGKLYGWIVSSHRHGSEPVVQHLTR